MQKTNSPQIRNRIKDNRKGPRRDMVPRVEFQTPVPSQKKRKPV